MRDLMLNPHNIQNDTKEEFEEYRRVISENLKKYELNEKMIFEYFDDTQKIANQIETKGGFCKYIQFKTKKDDVSFAKELYKNTGISLTPGFGFNSIDNGWMRLTFSVSPQRLERGLNALTNYIN
mgnify:CR=1 FL=1